MHKQESEMLSLQYTGFWKVAKTRSRAAKPVRNCEREQRGFAPKGGISSGASYGRPSSEKGKSAQKISSQPSIATS
jgi:hypothetical protein